jgi:circadian clock protein KaiC
VPDAAAGNARASTGIPGLDDVLGGGFPRNRLHLVQGDPGSGKTTAALQFLMRGREDGESGLYVTLSETADELRGVATSHDWSLDGITLYELPASDEAAKGDYTLFHPSEVELGKATQGVLEIVERVKPLRLVFDSLSEMRLLARDALRYRRQILALKQYFVGRNCTVLLLDDRTAETTDLQLESLAHGVIDFEQLAPEFGAERRRLRVKKMRAQSFRGGYHDFRIVRGGLRVFPRLVAAEHHLPFPGEAVPSGIPELDLLLGGGVDRGASTLVVGPAGAGKTSLAMRFALTAAERGHLAAVYAFEEGLGTLDARMRGLGWDLASQLQSGRLRLQQIDPAELTPGEFAHEVRRAVEEDGARVVVIDSLNGYLNAMPQEGHLALHLHELLAYLNQQGVATLMIMAQHGLLGSAMVSPVDLSYLADAVLLLRYFESEGAIRVAASVVKKRGGNHERTLRELKFGPDGARLGPPLNEFRGILTGVPVHTGNRDALLKPGSD